MFKPDHAKTHLGRMNNFRLERSQVQAEEVFKDRRVIESLKEHILKEKALQQEESGTVSLTAKQKQHQDALLPERLYSQDLTGKEIVEQTKCIKKAPFIKEIKKHPDYFDLPGFTGTKRLTLLTLNLLNGLRSVGNLFRNKNIHTMIGSRAEVNMLGTWGGNIWPAGLDLYSILGRMYPAFHGMVTGRIPEYVAENMDDLIKDPVPGKNIRGLGRLTVNDSGRFLGLYPVCQVPESEVTEDANFLSQDHLGRKTIVERVLTDCIEILKTSPKTNILVIDYAGGVGNLSEQLLDRIYNMSDQATKKMLMAHLKLAVVDVSQQQIEAGKKRFQYLSRYSKLQGIEKMITFIHGDVTESWPILKDRLKRAFGEVWLQNTVFMGMTAYTTGAMEALSKDDGRSFPQAMADEMLGLCRKIYAVDFSSPMWRRQDFLEDTGAWGHEYLRSVHGEANEEHDQAPLRKSFAAALNIVSGSRCRNMSDFISLMAIAPGLSSHYLSAWPSCLGHNSGYTILEDESLNPPSIISFAKRLGDLGASMEYKSKVRLLACQDLGRTEPGYRAWFFIPAWIADFVVAENHNPTGL